MCFKPVKNIFYLLIESVAVTEQFSQWAYITHYIIYLVFSTGIPNPRDIIKCNGAYGSPVFSALWPKSVNTMPNFHRRHDFFTTVRHPDPPNERVILHANTRFKARIQTRLFHFPGAGFNITANVVFGF